MNQSVIDNELLRGSGFVGGKNRIYEFFNSGTATAKEKAAFLKKEYGCGGRSYCEDYSMGYDPKGMHFKTRSSGEDITLTWNVVAKRISELIVSGLYLPDEVME